MVPTHHSGDKVIQDFTINNGFSQIMKYATRKSNILDIVLVNEPNTIFDVDVNSPFGCSDHCCVKFTIVIEFESSDSSAGTSAKQPSINKYYCWRDADYEGFAEFVANYDWSQLFSLNPSVNEMWSAFDDVMHYGIHMYVPVVSNYKRCQSGKRHYPKKVCKMFVRKHCLWRKFRTDRSNAALHVVILMPPNNIAKLCMNMKYLKRCGSLTATILEDFISMLIAGYPVILVLAFCTMKMAQ